MEYGPEINVFVLKMMMESGLEKIFLKFLHAQAIFRLIDLLHKVEGLCVLKMTNSVINMTWRDFQNKICGICTHD